MDLSFIEYAKYDTALLARSLTPPVTPTYPKTYDWLGEKKSRAELEAQRERVRQAFSRSFGAAMKSSEWVQAIMYVESAQNVEDLKRICDSFDIVWKDEGDMVTKNDEINALKSQIADLTKKLEKVEHGRMGKEPANGTVFKIEKRFSSSGPKYSYAAIRADGMWYLTGTSGAGIRSYTWEGLKKFVGDYSRVWAMNPKEELV